MKLEVSQTFPYTMEVAWKALHQPSKLDVELGAQVQEISATEWEARNEEANTITKYVASFNDVEKKLTIEGASNKKHDHDFIYLTLKEVDAERVSLTIEIEIDTGMHLIARALGALLAAPMKKMISAHIYSNFKALCVGQETKSISPDELRDMAKKVYEKENN